MKPDINTETRLFNLPVYEFLSGGRLDNLTRAFDYNESGEKSAVTVVSEHRAWGMTVGEFAEYIAADDRLEIYVGNARSDSRWLPLVEITVKQSGTSCQYRFDGVIKGDALPVDVADHADRIASHILNLFTR